MEQIQQVPTIGEAVQAEGQTHTETQTQAASPEPQQSSFMQVCAKNENVWGRVGTYLPDLAASPEEPASSSEAVMFQNVEAANPQAFSHPEESDVPPAFLSHKSTSLRAQGAALVNSAHNAMPKATLQRLIPVFNEQLLQN